MNVDTAYAIWRACFEGYERWLNQVERGQRYAAGDAWGCVGRWFAGRWHASGADAYARCKSRHCRLGSRSASLMRRTPWEIRLWLSLPTHRSS